MKNMGKRMAARLGAMRTNKLPVAEVTEARAIAKRVVEVLGDESKPRKEALRDMGRLTKSLESTARELDALTAFFKQQNELDDVAVSQFTEGGELLDTAISKLTDVGHESRHIETYLQNMHFYALDIIASEGFLDTVIDMSDEDYQSVEAAFQKIRDARAEHHE